MDEGIIQNLNERLENASENGHEGLSEVDVREQLEILQERAETVIRKHPVKSVIAGLLTGFIIAKIFNSED
ncbi:hypothetical protein AB2B38_002360 [Balneola sp. MJW-20]|uniref:hypothetical protein n=1 Tax=Gracilimonas aurantiaca TaxID=3234185 RepID=UPI003467ACE6